MGQAVGEGLKLYSSASDPNGKLLVEELGGNEEISGCGSGPEFHHVTEADASLLH